MKEKNNAVSTEESKKLSYEQLVELAQNLKNENDALRKQCQEMYELLCSKKLDYMFKIISTDGFSDTIKKKCIDAITDAMMKPEEEKK